ncbi:hypothetical protein HYG77_04910 [Rhodococcus sp. ZPP]|uniref:hypothetical protein n=1 Tax=Rhodococcus sp. ZPP TaxID=2749906 RepID=UPI001AD86594|nr:hypothetical protein [Rhodococcus sp. ZPP]QTJ65004.1 hypothetical protein HYG77_04910 [Rhodococcus sp. ZPP]
MNHHIIDQRWTRTVQVRVDDEPPMPDPKTTYSIFPASLVLEYASIDGSIWNLTSARVSGSRVLKTGEAGSTLAVQYLLRGTDTVDPQLHPDTPGAVLELAQRHQPQEVTA